MSLWDNIFTYFQDIIFNASSSQSSSYRFLTTYFTFGDRSLLLREYLCGLCTLVSILVIFVLCCLFIYRLVRLVGRLFSGGAL